MNIKNVNENVLKKIEELLMLQGLNANFVERLREVDKCVGSLKSMYLYGIGICYELKKGYSFNLYLKPGKGVNNTMIYDYIINWKWACRFM